MIQSKNYITYYGEYSLHNWIKMILHNEITLPEYQRYFVWNEKMAIDLVYSFSRGLFIPPITIAAYSGNENNISNLVLDGQQRLSAIILFYFGFWPTGFSISLKRNFVEDEDEDEDEDDIQKTYQGWDFKHLQNLFNKVKDIDIFREKLSTNKKYTNIEELLKNLDVNERQKYLDRYQNLKKNKQLIECNFLGFSFIKRINHKSEDEKIVFSEIFRSINTSSIALTSEESRSALYWLNPERKKFLAPELLSNIKVNNKNYDWCRCFSFVSEANAIFDRLKCNYPVNNKKQFLVAIGYGNKLNPFEKYIEAFARQTVNDNNDGNFTPYQNSYLERVSIFSSNLNTLFKSVNFESLIDADFYMFGLAFWVIFRGKVLTTEKEKLQILKHMIQSEIHEERMKAKQQKSVGKLGAIRTRLTKSIKIFQGYCYDK